MTLSVIVPALNEEQNIAATVATIRSVVPRYFQDYEILLFNDGSTDKTGAIAETLSAADQRIRVFHHANPKNLGACYKEGIQAATKDYAIMIPGDNECGVDVMENVFALAGNRDIVIPFTSNPEVRPVGRRVLSKLFVWMMNAASGCHLKYYNGAVLHRTDLVKKYGIETDSFGYQADLLVRMIRDGVTYEEVGTAINYRPNGKSKALRLTNIVRVGQFLGQLLLQRRLNLS
jgi:dolichol-phosphate mannosyltransferase